MPLHQFDGDNFDVLGVFQKDESNNKDVSLRSNQYEDEYDVAKNDGDSPSVYGRQSITSMSLGSIHSASIPTQRVRRDDFSANNRASGEDYSFDCLHESRPSISSRRDHATSYNQNGIGGAHIPEDVETESLSTMEDSFSVTNQQQQHQSKSANYTSRLSFQKYQTGPKQHQHFLHLNPRQNNQHRQTRVRSEGDHSSSSSSFYQESTSLQLESHVKKLSLELATTKASLDELNLEHRRVQSERDQLKDSISVLERENEKLRFDIERLEKEKLKMSMEMTMGVGRRADGLISSFVEYTNGKDNDANSGQLVPTFRAQARGKQRRKMNRWKTKTEGDLEVSFRRDIDRESYASRSSCSSQEFFTDGSFSDPGDAQSVTIDNCTRASDDENDESDLLSSTSSSLGPVGAFSGVSTDRYAATDGNNDDVYGESDPFSTWSARDDRAKRVDKPKNWFQRGLEGLNRANDFGNKDELYPDPFDTCSKPARGDDSDNPGVYTPFGPHSDSDSVYRSSRASDFQSSQNDRKKVGFPAFPWFKGRREEKR